jgi:hypothetical protein
MFTKSILYAMLLFNLSRFACATTQVEMELRSHY